MSTELLERGDLSLLCQVKMLPHRKCLSGAISTDSAAFSDMRCPTPHCETKFLADLDLSLLVSRWPKLSAQQRQQIMALLKATNEQCPVR
jgi:hypothetical protein